MANEHLILCGGARLSTRKQSWREAKTVELRINEDPGCVNCKISDITERLAANLADVEFDLLNIAAYVYGADQATTRGGPVRIDYGEAWYRDFRFEIPVLRPDFWSSSNVQNDLSRCLHDLSGDNFEFGFSLLRSRPPPRDYFEWGKDGMTGIDQVVLFSGGLDSLGGAIQEILVRKQKVVLISHRANPKIDARQKGLVEELKKRAKGRQIAPVHVPVWVNKAKELNKEYTQRTRSFLFSSLAAIIARMFGLGQIRFFENGITSLNLPISPQMLSTRASRTTHPKPLEGIQSLLSRVFNTNFRIENPFLWKTKTQILKEMKDVGHSSLCPMTVSCAHTWEMTTEHPHCGKCSQCLERRLVALAAGYGDNEDPKGGYKFNIFEDALEGLDRVLVESYVETVNRIQRVENPVQFCIGFPETNRAINYLGGGADANAHAIFKMHKQHADEVGGALDAQGRAAFPKLRLRQLPPDCLLSMIATGLRRISDRRDARGNGPLIIDEATFNITWRGGKSLEIGNRKEFHFLRILAASPDQYIPHLDLAESLGGDAQDEVTHIKSRLVKLLKENDLGDLAGCVKSQKGHYGLFLP